jgi:hypothetical protein
MDDIKVRLPIRLQPRKRSQLIGFGSALFGLLFAIVWLTTTFGFQKLSTFDFKSEGMFNYFFLGIGLLLVVSSVFGMFRAGGKLLPGSPFFHIALDPEGITLRNGMTFRYFAWSDLSPFTVAVRTTDDGETKKTRYWVVAGRAGDADLPKSDADRFKRAILRIDSSEYGEGDADATSAVLADLLNEMCDPASRNGDLIVPPELRGAVVARGRSTYVSTKSRRGGVIQR